MSESSQSVSFLYIFSLTIAIFTHSQLWGVEHIHRLHIWLY